VTSVQLVQGYDNRGFVLLCDYVFSILWSCVDFMVNQIVTRTARSHNIKNELYQAIIIEHSTETKIRLIVPLDHKNIRANLKATALAFKRNRGTGRLPALRRLIRYGKIRGT
jgi:short subunit dehydrogenase-like uncharacterized protein